MSVLKLYKEESQSLQELHEEAASGDKAAGIVPAISHPDAAREAQDLVENDIVEQMNLKRIEKLLRILASKLGIELTEPGRGRQ